MQGVFKDGCDAAPGPLHAADAVVEMPRTVMLLKPDVALATDAQQPGRHAECIRESTLRVLVLARGVWGHSTTNSMSEQFCKRKALTRSEEAIAGTP
jgi:hypothetical protein